MLGGGLSPRLKKSGAPASTASPGLPAFAVDDDPLGGVPPPLSTSNMGHGLGVLGELKGRLPKRAADPDEDENRALRFYHVPVRTE